MKAKEPSLLEELKTVLEVVLEWAKERLLEPALLEKLAPELKRWEPIARHARKLLAEKDYYLVLPSFEVKGAVIEVGYYRSETPLKPWARIKGEWGEVELKPGPNGAKKPLLYLVVRDRLLFLKWLLEALPDLEALPQRTREALEALVEEKLGEELKAVRSHPLYQDLRKYAALKALEKT